MTVDPFAVPVGAVVAEDIHGEDGRLLLKQGQQISSTIRARLVRLSTSSHLGPVRVAVAHHLEPARFPALP